MGCVPRAPLPPGGGCPPGQTLNATTGKCEGTVTPPGGGGGGGGGNGGQTGRPGLAPGGIPGAVQYPIWVYTGGTSSDIQQVPYGSEANPPANWELLTGPSQMPGDVVPDPTTNLCPDGSSPIQDATGKWVCPQTGSTTLNTSCAGLTCADKSTPTWDSTLKQCTCTNGSPPLNTPQDCPPGQTRNGTTGACVPIGTAGGGVVVGGGGGVKSTGTSSAPVVPASAAKSTPVVPATSGGTPATTGGEFSSFDDVIKQILGQKGGGFYSS